jgi:hypothetical protein
VGKWPIAQQRLVGIRQDHSFGVGVALDLGSEQKAAANRQLITVTRQRPAAGQQVPGMYHEPGLAWLERQAEVAEQLVA